MFFKYFSFCCLIYAQISWSYLVLPFFDQHVWPLVLSDLKDVGEPLILTPYLKLKQIALARELSYVEPFFKNITSNAGFFTVDETYNSNLFFWFFRKEGSDWENAPIVLWLQGGPGGSSMYGLFQENGPFTVIDNQLKRRKYYWSKNYNVIYIDQPVGTGFSFTNSSKGYARNQEQVADQLYEALIQFFQLYPELQGNKFIISGESYAGRYIPALAFKIHRLNIAGKCNINLKGLFMISATIDGIGLISNLGELCYQIGIVDSHTRDELKCMERERENYIHSRLWKKASQLSDTIQDKIYNHSRVNFYDYTSSVDSAEDPFSKFLQSSDTRKKIHVGNVNYTFLSDPVYKYLEADMSKTVVPWVEELLEYYLCAFIGGQYDLTVAYTLVIDVLKRLTWSGALEYSLAKRNILYDGKRVAGYSKRAGNLIEVYVRSAGHMVPQSEPRVTLNLLNEFTTKL